MGIYTEYIDAWKQRDVAVREKISRVREKLWKKLPEISRKLRNLGAKEVIVFGSLVEGDFKLDSDVDMAVKGLPEKDYIEAIITIEKIIVSIGVNFDLVLYEKAHPWIKEKIEKGKKI